MGTAPAFIPDTLDTSIYDEIIPITTQEAYGTARFLAAREGIFVGISSGAAVVGMVKVASRQDARDKVFLAILPRITSYNVCYTKLLRVSARRQRRALGDTSCRRVHFLRELIIQHHTVDEPTALRFARIQDTTFQ